MRRAGRIALLLAAGAAVAFLESAQDHLAHAGWKDRDPFGFRFTHTLPVWMIAALLVPAIAWFVRRRPPQLAVRSLTLHLGAGCVFALTDFTLLALFHHFVLWPGQPIVPTIRIFVVNYFLFYVMLYWLIAITVRFIDVRQLEASLARARLDGLRAQLNPHFLFNVLNTAAMLSRKGRIEETIDVLSRLAELLRYVLREEPDVTLGDELGFVRQYLELEQVRFADRLQIRFDADPALVPLRVPSLLLQPLVENAVRHGISKKPGSGRIEIVARREGNRVQLEVRDDGAGLTKADGGIGVRNTRERLAHRYGSGARLSLNALPGGGTAAVVTLPLEDAA
ncbi:MAG: histidine kinase [Myxococcales bacterium]|nr:histidine kinase [Myxococcales bacterium]